MSSSHSHTQSPLLLVEKVLLLKSLSVFTDTPETILAEIARLMVGVEFAKGQEIVREGEVGNCMYIISEGLVAVYKGSHLIAKLSGNDFFGELALLDTEARSATVKAGEDCHLFRVDQEPFYDLIDSRPEVVRGVIRILCKRIRATNDKLFQLQQEYKGAGSPS